MEINKPLEGIKVVEISTIVTASLATMMMSDQGAEVIKIEQKGIGDPMRYLGTQKGGTSALFANCNRGKSSIDLDLKNNEDLEIARRLIQEADVLINNFRPGVMEGLGLSHEECKNLNESLIYVSINGFGNTGPFSNHPAYDHVVQAMSGATSIQASEDNPEYIKTLLCDKITAYTACQSISSALFKRERTGIADKIDLSMIDSAIFFLWPDGMMNHTLLDKDVPQLAPLTKSYSMYQCKDGAISIAALADRHWFGIFKAIEKPEFVEDERFNNMMGRSENMVELIGALSAFSELTVSEAIERLEKEDVPCSKNITLDELMDHPQIKANELLQQISSDHQGSVRAIRYPAIFNGEKLINSKPAPSLGEDKETVLNKS